MEKSEIDKNKILLILCLVASLAMCAYLICSLVSISKSLKDARAMIENSDVKMKQMEDSIIRGQSQLVSNKEMEKYLSNLGLDAIKKDISTLNGKVDIINVALVKTPGYSGKNIPSTREIPSGKPEIPPLIPCVEDPNQKESGKKYCVNPDKYGYLNKEQELAINEPFKNTIVPFGTTTFKAWEEKPWSLNVFPRTYSVKNVIAEDEDGKSTVYNKFEVEVQGKNYPIEIASSTSMQESKDSEFWFNPKIYLGTGVGVVVTNGVRAEVVPSLEISLFSRGPNKRRTDWSFLNLGIGAHTQNISPVVTISPVNYNVGEPLPLLDNLFIGPAVGVDIEGNISITGGVRVGL